MSEKEEHGREDTAPGRILGRGWSAAKRVAAVLDVLAAFNWAISGWIVGVGVVTAAWAHITSFTVPVWVIKGVLTVITGWLIWVSVRAIRAASTEARARESAPTLTAREMIPVSQATKAAMSSSAVVLRTGHIHIAGNRAEEELARDLVRRFIETNPDAVSTSPHPIVDGLYEEFVAKSRYWAFLDQESAKQIDKKGKESE